MELIKCGYFIVRVMTSFYVLLFCITGYVRAEDAFARKVFVDRIDSIDFANDDKTIVAASYAGKTVFILNALTLDTKHTIRDGESWFNIVACSPKGRVCAAASMNGPKGRIHLVDIERGVFIREVSPFGGMIRCLRYDISGNRLVASGNPLGVPEIWQIAIFDASDLSISHSVNLGERNAENVSFVGDSDTIRYGRNELFDWDPIANSHKRIEGIEMNEFTASDDSRMIATGGGAEVLIYDMKTNESKKIHRKLITEKTTRDSTVECTVAFSKNAELLAVGHEDGNVAVFRLDGLRRIKHIDSGVWICDVKFSKNGKVIAVAGGDIKGAIALWNLTDENK